MEETMRPTTAFDDNVFDITALLHPGTVSLRSSKRRGGASLAVDPLDPVYSHANH
jgi:hypothetical protein